MTVRKRKDRGWWEFSFELERGPDGQRRQVRKGGFATKKLAEQAEAQERIEQATRGALPFDEKTLTVAAFMARWLDSRKPPRLAPSAHQRYEELSRLYIVPAIGKLELRKLRALDVEAALEAVRAAGRSPTTVVRVYSALHAALGQAVRWRLVGQNVAAYVDKPRTPTPDLYTPTLEETRRLLKRADGTRFAIAYWLAALTGCREGELLALRWHNVDLAGRTLLVEGSARRLTGQGVVLKDTKSHKSRTVALSEEAALLLSAQRERIAEARSAQPDDYQNNDLVFADALGRPLDGTWLGKVWRKQVAEPECGREHEHKGCIGSVRVHDLRHFHVTHLLRLGVPLPIVSGRVGHQSAAFTADVYGHLVAPDQVTGADLLGEGLR